MEFGPGGGKKYAGYQVFALPANIAPNSVTGLQVKVNYQGPRVATQTWTWQIYDWTRAAYVIIGTNAGAPDWGAWQLLQFNVSGTLANYIRSGDGQIRLQLLSNNTADVCDIDYEAVVVTYGTVPTGGGVSVSIAPASMSISTGATQQFSSSVQGSSNTGISWSVNGIAGGNATVGTISSTGLYKAPVSAPNPATVTIKAVSQADVTKSASASVSILAAPIPSPNPTAYWKPEPGASWQWQLAFDSGASSINTSIPASIYDIDGFTTSQSTMDTLHAQGRRTICYFSAGSYENGRPDSAQFPAAVLGKVLDGWPDEKWLDIRRIDLLAPIMTARMDMCKAKGFDAIEPDNVDGYTNATGFPLTAADQLAYNRWLAQQAHARGLSIALKNDIDQIPDLWQDFDFAINEQCFQYGECGNYVTYFTSKGKAVFNVEYSLSKNQFCSQAKSYNFSSLKKTLNLTSLWDPC